MIKETTPWFQYPSYSWDKKTVTVVGAGIAGSQIAWHLAKRGWKVTVIERNPKPAQEASGNIAGIISPKVTAKPSLGEDFYSQCFLYTLEQLELLQRQPSSTLNWNPVGVLQLAYKDRDYQRWKQLQERIITNDFTEDFLQCLDDKAASQIANIAIKHPAIYFPNAGWIDPVSFCNTLLMHENITLIKQSEAIDITHNNNKEWEVSDAQNHLISTSEAVVICSGKDLDFAPISRLPSVAIAGQTSLAVGNKKAGGLKTALDHEGYITPVITSNTKLNQQQQLLFGATYDLNSMDDSLDPKANQHNFEKLQRHLPDLANGLTDIESGHAAIRRVTPDRLPYLGAVPDLLAYRQDYNDLHHGKHWKHYPKARYYPKLFISAAYGSRGLTTSGLCAKALACMMNGEDSPVSDALLQALHPARFCIRDLKKGTEK
ncbi:MAG: FAD-dependent 5-carboxymethylaminomethyl-2-thiouridine(34) oxidoreductase MnmC [Thiotrichaceae bacterium]